MFSCAIAFSSKNAKPIFIERRWLAVQWRPDQKNTDSALKSDCGIVHAFCSPTKMADCKFTQVPK